MVVIIRKQTAGIRSNSYTVPSIGNIPEWERCDTTEVIIPHVSITRWAWSTTRDTVSTNRVRAFLFVVFSRHDVLYMYFCPCGSLRRNKRFNDVLIGYCRSTAQGALVAVW